MKYMFRNAPSFNQPLNNWNTSKAQYLEGMFHGATAFNQPLNGWDTSKATNMLNMFRRTTSFDQPLASWNLASTTNMAWMFADAGLSTANLDATLAGWATQNLQPNVPFHIGAKTYSSIGASALTTLRGLGWTITEQVVHTYNAGVGATLSGTARQQLSVGSNSSAVEVIPGSRYRFVRWSDGVTDNPRTDVAGTDNLTVTAILEHLAGGPCLNCNSRNTDDDTEPNSPTPSSVGAREEDTAPVQGEIPEAPEEADDATSETLPEPKPAHTNIDPAELVDLLVALGTIPADKIEKARALLQTHRAKDDTHAIPTTFRFTHYLKEGDTGDEVRMLQRFLNTHGFRVAQTGPGSLGNETDYFGPQTKDAVMRYQGAYPVDILVPLGLTAPTGEFHRMSLKKANALLATS